MDTTKDLAPHGPAYRGPTSVVRRHAKPLVVTTIAAALTLGLVAPASAATRTVHDNRKRDAKASLDITKVSYRLTDERAKAAIHVRNLKNKSTFVFAVTNRSTDLRFGAVITGRGSKSPKKRFFHYQVGSEPNYKRCPTKVRWNSRQDVLRIAFPDRCFKPLGKRVTLGVASTKTGLDRGVDHLPNAQFTR